jgi:hypothetical protein
VINFYKTIGLTQNIDSRFLGPFGINLYPLQWIIYTTPPIILFLFLIGIFTAAFRIGKEKDKISLLFILWFLVPVVRVIWPGTTIYGGVRQIMEYIPAMAVLAGLGARFLLDLSKRKYFEVLTALVIIIGFLLLVFRLYKIHPNENVYFNFLIGGLSGAKQTEMPFWGFSFGSPYRQAVSWINKNAERGANVVYTYDLIPNIPRIWMRQDLNLHNANRSGYLRRGEYAMGLVYDGTSERSYYDAYLEKFIEPVYQVKVDGVPILKIWKNDDQHLKLQLKERLLKNVKVEKRDFGLRFDLNEIKKLSRLEISYDQKSCKPLVSGYVQISKDGKRWERLPGVLPNDWKISLLGKQPRDGKFIEAFVGQEVRFIDLAISPVDTCLAKVKDFEIYVFDNQ